MLVRVDRHVHTDLGDHVLDRRAIDPRDGIQPPQPRLVQQRAELLGNATAELLDMTLQLIQVAQQVLHQEPMMGAEVALQRQLQLGDLGTQPALSQLRQPLTTGVWLEFDSPMSRRLIELSDVVSFHGYDGPSGIAGKLAICRRSGRPILCTEWLNRPGGNTVESILPLFQARRIGCWSWGLVFGRSQTYMRWGSKPGDPVPSLWQHDLLHADGSPFRACERDLIRKLVATSAAIGRPG